ncbi:hypothetical protein N7474_008902 [Penicillium riverlandense]|uniref:uncharacterized protein n=1 Tax=Penicillium riverlandense TaxID=1903569 RepID=UPI00254858BA|nr:uncharacterized protein N7474_008902 [Penicillium riverlandense]KAJ5812601.1 hypothetical protein N7474_008902 [Penicillium riverlandense]
MDKRTLETNAFASQLCALSTVGIAPSGFALGRVERTRLARRKTLPPQDQPPCATRPAATDARPKTSISISTRGTDAGTDWTHSKDDGGDLRKSSDLRRASLSFGAARLRRRGQTLTNPPLRIAEEEVSQSRPSSSWLRRLSLASFQTDSASVNSPVTPSFNGSASPMLPRPPSQRRAPNKLIKRSSSQASNVFVNPAPALSNPTALRRPATSYQRSESMRLNIPIAADFASRFSGQFPESPVAGDFELNQETDWKPYLLPRADRISQKLARRLSTSGSPKVQVVRRLMSDGDTVPALVLATAITVKTTAGNLQSVPVTPVEVLNPIQATRITPPADQNEKLKHKHSYSLNDVETKKTVVANTVTATGTPLIGRPRGGSLKRVKGRTFSIPRSELSRSESMLPSSPQPRPRRNVTDPSLSRRPHTIAQPGMAFSTRVGPRSVSHDYQLGASALRSPRPLSSDVLSWQHGSYRPDYTPSLRNRPKRHSIAASDPASTIIGSDDTRVFTSGDEYETDLVSDYWDSVRTRESNRSGAKGLRIETMFDKAGPRLSNEAVATLEDLIPRSVGSRLEQNPLFPDTLLASPTLPQQVVENVTVLSDVPDAGDTCSMISVLPNDSVPKRSPSGKSVETTGSAGKMNIFDWSEQPRSSDREPPGSETRPRTVHGKQECVDRGSRATGRKATSTIHLRSQSVPVARDPPMTESRQSSGKFGTWGLGTKGVSEDWDSDFDFDEPQETNNASPNSKPSESDNRQSMTVPKAILERQASLHGQFGQVQELTLLVEELKRLRHQASVLDLASGPSSELWKEAEGIVNLATIDDDDHRSPPRSPSSLTFSFDESDEEAVNTNGSSKRNSDNSWQNDPEQDRPSSSGPPLGQLTRRSPKSKSVLDMLSPSRGPARSALDEFDPATRTQKLPFDTSSLRDLVVRAGVVTRALKEVIRKAEGVSTSPPDVFPSDPPFRRIFDQPSHDDLASFEAAMAEMH